MMKFGQRFHRLSALVFGLTPLFWTLGTSAHAQDIEPVPTQTVETPLLSIAYEVRGPEDGQAVILLHGFPDDVRSWDAVATGLADAGFRTYAPYLRGYGPTTFLEEGTPRVGQNGALAQDVIDFADALGLERFILVGHDWGAQAAQGVAVLAPDRVIHLVSFAPYSLTWSDYQEGPPDYPQIKALWYQNVLNSEMGEGLLMGDRRGFARYLWETWSPTWTFSDATFEATAVSFDNPDFVPVVLQAYRGTMDPSSNDPRYADIEARFAERPPITVPTTVLLGAADGINLFDPSMLQQQSDFTGGYEASVVEGVGHFIHRERPDLVVATVVAAAS